MMTPQKESFTQHVLSEAQLRAGLMALVDAVQIPDEPIAATSLRANEVEKRAGVSFQESFDDLDSGYFAVLEFSGGFSVTLKDYLHSPVGGVQIYTDPAGNRSRERLAAILDGLSLVPNELIWITADLK